MGFIVKGVKSVVKAVGSVVKGVVGVVSKVVGAVFGFAVGSKTKAKATTTNTLNKSLEPEAYRKIIFGRTASPLDLRFWEVWGKDGSRYDEVLASAAHRINAYLELYMENDLAINAASVVQPKFAGVLSRDTRLGASGQTAMAVGSNNQWTNTATFDGVPHMKLAWVPDEKKLPNGIPSRYTQVVEGALVYDPRRDSTVSGGTGTHRADDRSTWSYSTLDGNGVPIGRNNALQALWYLLGWTVPTKDTAGKATGEMLVAGRGVDPQDINLASFIAGANACEIAGYYTDMVLSTEDTHTSNEDKITCDGLIGRLIDPGGLWSYYANVDDTANIAVDLTDADIIQGVSVNWNEYESMSSQFNQVSGKFINPSPTTLFQAFPYPMVRDATYEANLGIKRRKPQDFEQVLDGVLAQRLARLLLNQGQYQGEFQAGFNYRAMKAQAWSVVRYTSERFGFTKLFRVYRHDISTDAGIGMLLKEIHPSIWGAGTVTPPLAPGLGTNYQANQEISLTGLVVVRSTIEGSGENATVYDAAIVSWDEPPVTVRRTQVRYRIVGSDAWETSPSILRGSSATVLIGPLVKASTYEVQARHVSINEVEGPWINYVGNFDAGQAGNVDYAGIVDAGTKAEWPNVSDPAGTRPSDNADVTKDVLDEAMKVITGKTASEVVYDFQIQLGTLALEMLRNATYRGESDQIIRTGDGTTIRRVTEILSVKTEGLASGLDNAATFIASLKEVDSDGNAKALQTINGNGVVTGSVNILTGERSSYYIMANEFGFVDPGSPGDVPKKPFYYSNGRLYADDLFVQKLAFGAMDDEFEALQSLSPGNFTQKLPGGLIMKGGQFRGYINDEVSLTVIFDPPFPNGVLTFVPVPFIYVASNLRDLWLQVQGEPSVNGATVYAQAATSNQQKLDGFNWFAIGN